MLEFHDATRLTTLRNLLLLFPPLLLLSSPSPPPPPLLLPFSSLLLLSSSSLSLSLLLSLSFSPSFPPPFPALNLVLHNIIAMLSSVAALTTSFTAPAGIVSSAARSTASPRMGVSDMCAVARMEA